MGKAADLTKLPCVEYIIFTGYFFVLLAPLWQLKVGPMWDANDYVYPVFTYIADSVREGRFPLWDPYTNCGEPFYAEPQKMVLNPLALLLGLTIKNTFLGFTLLWLLHWWWGGIGMLWLARYFGANRAGALVSSVLFTFSGFYISNAEHTPFIIVASWLPWIFGMADKAVASSQWWWALLAAAALGLCALCGGYPVLVAFTGFAVALWLVLRFIVFKDVAAVDCRSTMKLAVWVGGTLVVMAVISIIVWSPLLHAFLTETAGFTDRLTVVKSNESLYGMPFSWRAALSLMFPYSTIMFYGVNMINGIDWMLADVSMTNGYVGVLAIPMACIWLFDAKSRQRHLWLLVFIIFMLLISLGGNAGLRILLNELLPFLRLMRFNAAFRLFWIFPLALSAGLGFSMLAKSEITQRSFIKILFVWSLVSLLVAAVIKYFAFKNGLPFMDHFPRIFFPALFVIPLALALTLFWIKYASATKTQLVIKLFVLLVCVDMGCHLYNNSFTVWTKTHIINVIESNHVRTTAVHGEPLARGINSQTGFMNAHIVLKIPLVSGYVTNKSVNFNDILINSRFSELLTAPFRFWLVPGVEKMPGDDEALRRLSESGRNDAMPVYVEGSPLISNYSVLPGSYGSVITNYYAPEEIRLTVKVPGLAGGFLTGTERYAVGWKAWIDGVPQNVEKNNIFFRGLYVPSGEHKVVWKYQPDLWWPLVILSYVTLFTTVGIAFIKIYKENTGKC